MATNKSILQSLWSKEVKRIRQFISRATKRGYTFPASVIPKKPKRVTQKSVDRLKKLTADVLYSRSKYKSPTTGEIISGLEGRKQERSASARKGHITRSIRKKSKQAKPRETERDRFYRGRKDKGESDGDLPRMSYVILENIREEIDKWAPLSSWTDWFADRKKEHKNILVSMLDGAIKREGEDVIAARLESQAEQVLAIVQEILYSSGGNYGAQVQHNFARFANILLGRPLTPKESIDLSDAQEYWEDNEIT